MIEQRQKSGIFCVHADGQFSQAQSHISVIICHVHYAGIVYHDYCVHCGRY